MRRSRMHRGARASFRERNPGRHLDAKIGHVACVEHIFINIVRKKRLVARNYREQWKKNEQIRPENPFNKRSLPSVASRASLSSPVARLWKSRSATRTQMDTGGRRDAERASLITNGGSGPNREQHGVVMWTIAIFPFHDRLLSDYPPTDCPLSCLSVLYFFISPLQRVLSPLRFISASASLVDLARKSRNRETTRRSNP